MGNYDSAGRQFLLVSEGNFDWVPDTDHGSVAMFALQTMLLQEVGDRILLCPAWPKEWDVEFRLHASHNTVVTGEVRGGKVINLGVTPESRRADVEVLLPEG